MNNAVLFTGGSGKIGVAYLMHAVSKGINVLATVRSVQRFAESRPDLAQAETVRLVEADFTKKDAIGKICDFIRTNNIEIKTVVHNARCTDYLRIDPDGTTSIENFTNELFLDVVFPYRLTVELLQHGLEFKNVVFVSSMYGVIAPTPSLYEDFEKSSPINYGVAKSAQIHLVKELAVRLADKGIRVNCISYGGIEGRTDEDFISRYKKLTPLKKMLSAEDAIPPLDFLISDNSKDMTGHNLVVDGGWCIW